MENLDSKEHLGSETGVSLLHSQYTIGWQGLVPQPILADREMLNNSCRTTLVRELVAPDHWVVRAEIENIGQTPVHLRRIRWTGSPMGGQGRTLRFPANLEPFFFATENFRGDYFTIGTTRGDRYFKPLPNETVELGWSEDQVFPGLFIGSRVQS